MLKETDGDTYEGIRSLNQDLTFTAAEEAFSAGSIPFGANQKKTLRLLTPDNIYTNLALLLSEQSVHTVKLGVFEGIEKAVFKDRREFSGSLLKQLHDAYDFLDMYNHTHAEVNGLYRTDTRDYPEEAVREALLNALVHRDYAFSSSSLISIFDDRMEFVSPGGLPRGISLDDVTLGLSVPRNESLADIFYRLKLIEAYGMGIPKILRSYADFPEKPVLQATDNAFKITLPNRNVNPPVYSRAFPSMGSMVSDVTAVYLADAPFPFSENEARVLALLKRKPVIVRKDVEDALAVSQAMAVRVLRGLLDKQAIRSVGGGKNTRYVLPGYRR
jgi:ATP-dependent DNA helicase RecG